MIRKLFQLCPRVIRLRDTPRPVLLQFSFGYRAALLHLMAPILITQQWLFTMRHHRIN